MCTCISQLVAYIPKRLDLPMIRNSITSHDYTRVCEHASIHSLVCPGARERIFVCTFESIYRVYLVYIHVVYELA